MRRAMMLALGVTLLATPVQAQPGEDIATMTAWVNEMNVLLMEAVADPAGTLPAIDTLRATFADFTPSDACVLPAWATMLGVLDAYRSAVVMFSIGEAAKAAALADHGVAMSQGFDVSGATAGCP